MPRLRRKDFPSNTIARGPVLACATASLSRLWFVAKSVVRIDPEIMSGTPCFDGTRVSIQILMDYLEGGDSIDEFLDGFPTVTREQVVSFLEEAKESALARVG